MPDGETTIYEIAYLLNDECGEEKTLAFANKLREAIADKEGLIISEGTPKKQPLAYPVKEKNVAILNWVKFATEPQFLEEIEELLKKDTNILRFLATKKSKKEEAAKKPMFKPKSPLSQTTMSKTEKQKTEEGQEKPAIKEEEIDKKLEELLGE
ncbi:MAG: hypothetical protein COT67_01315 [Candidatus Tagabacteria bacterium CG09_land_8_20_14_0_10_41_14]|uniref:Small ribosomal subunit protein bS6 n=2 Tax=Candidatus Tagaibacteriota TaxID=1817918 RepID=A0A2H0WLQ8_9BACT|nr:MAG: hypothetical protein COT67_01315 [Candidatus Tagabacteria bacterium CG09_land_8_20_14_0_10_41_14]PJE73059.1 MAG: hypothetical protein COV00_01810 [Candidatus Tagabacteria bacterium CG10_big_fil_rev_8_21_14_0_10_40_13]